MGIKINEQAWISAQLYDMKEALVDPGGGSEGPDPSVRPDSCLRLKFFIDKIVYHFLTGWFFFNETRVSLSH